MALPCGEDCGGGDQTPPDIWLDTPGPVYVQYPTLTVHWCDNASLDASSRWIKVNGVLQTGSFGYSTIAGYCGAEAQSTSTSVSLNLGSNTIEMRICDLSSNCTTITEWINRMAGPLPLVSPAPYGPDLQDYGRCATACFAATAAHATVPYFSLDAPRNVTLVYNGDRVDPKPFVHVDVTPGAGAPPSAFQLRLRRPGAQYLTFLNGSSTLYFTANSGTWRLGGQFDASANGMGATDVYDVEVVVGAHYPDGLVETVVPTRVIVVNETSSPIARGWSVAGVQRVYPRMSGSTVIGALVTEGDGSATYFHKVGSVFTSPTGDFSKLTSNAGGYERAYPDSTRVTFDTQGRMLRVRDAWGNRDSITYDGSGRISRIIDPTGYYRELVYGASGLWAIAARTAGGAVMALTTDYDVSGAARTLNYAEDPDDVRTVYSYDGANRLWKTTDRNGVVATELGYHQSGKLTSVTGPLIPLFGGTSARPAVTTAPWHHVGVPYGVTSLASPAPAARADTVRASVTDAGGHLTRFTVNAFGQPLATTDHAGNVATVIYTAAGQVDSVIDPLGVNAGFDYDGNGNVTRATAGGLTTRARYHTTWVTQPDSIWGDGRPIQRIGIGANGRVSWVNSGGAPSSFTYAYDARGRVEASNDPEGHLVLRSWYAGQNGNRSRDSVPGGRVRVYGHDGIGRLTSDSASGQPRRSFEYDGVNRRLRAFDGVNPLPTVFAYDSLRLRSVTDPRSQVHAFTYNALGWVIKRTDPAGRSDSTQYDSDGLPRWTRNRSLQSWEAAYDALHRMTWRGGDVLSASFSYSSDARVVTATNANATVTTYLSAVRRQTDSVRTTISIPGYPSQSYLHRYGYRSNGLLDSIGATGPGLTFMGRRFGYHSTRFTMDSLWLGGALSRFTRNEDGQTTALRFSGPDSINYQYVPGHDPVQLSSRLLSDWHHMDEVGRIDQHKAGGFYWRYGYHGLGGLRSVSFHNPATSCYPDGEEGWDCPVGYFDSMRVHLPDPSGNVVERQMLGPGYQLLHSEAGTYGPGNRIGSFAGCDYGTDFDGRVTTRTCGGATTTFGWSADGLLTSMLAGTSITFAYDPLGRVVRRDVNGASSNVFLWEGNNLFAELDGPGTWRRTEYSYFGMDDLHAIVNWMSGTPVRYYAHRDAAGNIRGLTHEAGGVGYNRTYEYGPWGEDLGGGDGAGFSGFDRARWKGALSLGPEAGLYYMRNRWYETRTGRFLSEDPIGLSGGLNMYAFANGDQIGGSDPLGLQSNCPQPLGMGITICSEPDPNRGWQNFPWEWWEQHDGNYDGDCAGQNRQMWCAWSDRNIPDRTPTAAPRTLNRLATAVSACQQEVVSALAQTGMDGVTIAVSATGAGLAARGAIGVLAGGLGAGVAATTVRAGFKAAASRFLSASLRYAGYEAYTAGVGATFVLLENNPQLTAQLAQGAINTLSDLLPVGFISAIGNAGSCLRANF